LLYVQWKTPDDGQRNCSKHVEFHSKKKFEELVHLGGFIRNEGDNVANRNANRLATTAYHPP